MYTACAQCACMQWPGPCGGLLHIHMYVREYDLHTLVVVSRVALLWRLRPSRVPMSWATHTDLASLNCPGVDTAPESSCSNSVWIPAFEYSALVRSSLRADHSAMRSSWMRRERDHLRASRLCARGGAALGEICACHAHAMRVSHRYDACVMHTHVHMHMRPPARGARRMRRCPWALASASANRHRPCRSAARHPRPTRHCR